jgi:hexosaminidase
MGNKIHEYNSAEDAIALKSKLAEGTIVQFWKGDLDLIEETAQKGYDIVNSYHYGTYLDYDKSRIPLAKSYAFNPIPAGMDKSLQYKILGLGCQMWGEQILTVESMNRMTFPRIAAYAEIGWVSPARKNYMEFLPALMRLVKFNKHYETGER